MKGADGQFKVNRKSVTLCPGYKDGTCTSRGTGGRCGQDSQKTHQCGICLQQHATIDHDKLTKKPQPKGKAQPKGKGAGRRRR